MREKARYYTTRAALVFCALAVAVFLFQRASAQDEALRAVGACVERVASAEGYSGNPASAEAWQLFAPSCAQ